MSLLAPIPGELGQLRKSLPYLRGGITDTREDTHRPPPTHTHPWTEGMLRVLWSAVICADRAGVGEGAVGRGSLFASDQTEVRAQINTHIFLFRERCDIKGCFWRKR